MDKRKPIEKMIDEVMVCTLCGEKDCDCWDKCPSCGWLYRKGGKCRNNGCAVYEIEDY